MKSITQIDRFEYFLSFTGFFSSAVLAIYALIFFLTTEPPRPPEVGEIRFSGDTYSAYNSSRIAFIRLIVIAACFVFSFLIVRFTRKTVSRLAAIPFLAVSIFQTCVISREGFEAVQVPETEPVIKGLLFLSYLGFLVILPATLLIFRRISFFWKKDAREFA